MITRKSFSGFLQDQYGNPIGGAVLMLSGVNHQLEEPGIITDEKGCFYISELILPGCYEIEIRWRDAVIHKTIQLDEYASRLSVTLSAWPSADDSGTMAI